MEFESLASSLLVSRGSTPLSGNPNGMGNPSQKISTPLFESPFVRMLREWEVSQPNPSLNPKEGTSFPSLESSFSELPIDTIQEPHLENPRENAPRELGKEETESPIIEELAEDSNQDETVEEELKNEDENPKPTRNQFAFLEKNFYPTIYEESSSKDSRFKDSASLMESFHTRGNPNPSSAHPQEVLKKREETLSSPTEPKPNQQTMDPKKILPSQGNLIKEEQTNQSQILKETKDPILTKLATKPTQEKNQTPQTLENQTLAANSKNSQDSELSPHSNPNLKKRMASPSWNAQRDAHSLEEPTKQNLRENKNVENHLDFGRGVSKNDKYKGEIRNPQPLPQNPQPNPTNLTDSPSTRNSESSSLGNGIVGAQANSGNKPQSEGGGQFQDNKFSWNVSSLRQKLDSVGFQESIWNSQDKRDSINRLIEQAKIQILGNEKSSAEIRLKPEELGRMVLKIQVHQDKVEGKILVDSETVRSALLNDLNQLREEFRSQGLQLESLEIDLSFQSHGDSGSEKAFLSSEESISLSPSMENPENSDPRDREEIHYRREKSLLDVIA